MYFRYQTQTDLCKLNELLNSCSVTKSKTEKQETIEKRLNLYNIDNTLRFICRCLPATPIFC